MHNPPREGRKTPASPGNWQQAFRDAGPYLGLGMQLALTMVFFTIGGYLLDGWLGTAPWLTIAGAVMGMVAVFFHIVRVSRNLGRKDEPRRGGTAK